MKLLFLTRNLIDAANIAALAALSTFRRPECSVGGEDSQEIIMHDPEVRFSAYSFQILFFFLVNAFVAVNALDKICSFIMMNIFYNQLLPYY